MFLVGNAPPHMDYAQDTKYPEVLRMARDRGIVVNAVQAGGARDTERAWREVAQLGNGRYIPIPQDGGHIVIIETPYDHDIIELQDEINGTVIPYGPRRQRSDVEQKTKLAAAAPRPLATEMAGYLSRNAARTSGEAITGNGDLVADLKVRTAETVGGQGRRPAGCAAQDERGRAPCLHRQTDGEAAVAQ
jgi:hypothetical protein